LRDDDGQPREHRVGGPLAALDSVKRAFIAFQRGPALFLARVAFIGEVVGAAGEGVDRLDRRH
jgi:hypothetical protein